MEAAGKGLADQLAEGFRLRSRQAFGRGDGAEALNLGSNGGALVGVEVERAEEGNLGEEGKEWRGWDGGG